ncbi:unnamed protein product [Paramecium sonneborni]|uniref:Uncharacterized protein n=1 Tax=Paramecium sonneborni TaxID=65129 RepID=A0A8S1MHR7_9CILI|nr:unnamed protein product [Paramecium sonneborni]
MQETSQQNEMIVQFFIENGGNSFLVEGWCLIQFFKWLKEQYITKIIDDLVKICYCNDDNNKNILRRISHNLLFYNKNTKKRSDWIDDSKLQLKKITTKFFNQQNFQLAIAQQGLLQLALQERMNKTVSPLYKRYRYLSEQIYDREPQVLQRKMKNDSDLLYSKKEKVEQLQTPEEAVLNENYEINMMTNDYLQKEIFISQIIITNKLSSEEKNFQQQILNTLKNFHNKSKNRRIRSLQITKLLNFYRQLS